MFDPEKVQRWVLSQFGGAELPDDPWTSKCSGELVAAEDYDALLELYREATTDYGNDE